jgi:hypothetical protein
VVFKGLRKAHDKNRKADYGAGEMTMGEPIEEIQQNEKRNY